MLERWNTAIDLIEENLDGEVDVAALARAAVTSEYHFRRVFSVLAGMPLSEYIRRRRMSVAAAAVVAGEPLIDIAVRYGYGSADAFRRAFVAVHGITPDDARRPGAILTSQARLTLRLTIEGSAPMRHRINDLEPFRIVGPGTRIPLVYRGPNPDMIAFHRSLPASTADDLAKLSDMAEPAGPFSASTDFAPDRADGSEFHYVYGVATRRPAGGIPDSFDVIEVPAHTWVAFEVTADTGFFDALQQVWADAYGEWFPSHPYRTVAAPEILAVHERSADGDAGRAELWLAVEREG
ncbi:AraC family transcriptional regulator [Microbacterium invictum]|uniref:Helix-turn-helix domain-containing protein n=1 Tax=Microbacterium invictum TaxID=515415 RepID=A0ABZ0V9E7_9MICO|nr:helix-turn-helix domain-containing protein [Microbacterium invictum]WQB69754.1 helix-turn-helix domain-containing protein [Microbacterium invictum]